MPSPFSLIVSAAAPSRLPLGVIESSQESKRGVCNSFPAFLPIAYTPSDASLAVAETEEKN